MLHIYVIEAGWVVVGEQTDSEPHEIALTRASFVRRWGTTDGLGQLASKGPTDSTVLDAAPDGIIAPAAKVILRLPCHIEAWEGYYAY